MNDVIPQEDLTEWFPSWIRPNRDGRYLCSFGKPKNGQNAFYEFRGGRWLVSLRDGVLHRLDESLVRTLRWRGLNYDPNPKTHVLSRAMDLEITFSTGQVSSGGIVIGNLKDPYK
jgi:hypothetical protein